MTKQQAHQEPSKWSRHHLLDIESLTQEDMTALLNCALDLEDVSKRSIKKRPDLHGKVVANLFFENSTRTRTSFSLAASRLSADVLDFSSSSSSISKGETLRDTARNIEAMGVDVIVCRHNQAGASVLLSQSVNCSVINAGDGRHEHPTQGLLDIFTIAKRKNRTKNFDLSGLKVAIVGDIANSRVARSNIHGLQKLGAKVILVGPPTLLPACFAQMGCEISYDFDNVISQVDVINMLRVQFERINGPAFPSVREYVERFGLHSRRFAKAKKDALVMHPGPLNRGVEISSTVADGPHSAILEQVTNGLAVRMASLKLVTQAC